MASKRHSGTNETTIQAQRNQIESWLTRGNFSSHGHEGMDRVVEGIDWTAEIDPTLDVRDNYSRIKAKYGIKSQGQKEKERKDYNDQAGRARAEKALSKNFDAIESGEKQQLVDDIAAEFGRSFVDDILSDLRQDVRDTGELPEPEPEPQPEPETPEPEPTPEIPVAKADITPSATPGPEPTPELVESPEPQPKPQPQPTPEPTEIPEPISALIGVCAWFVRIHIQLFQAGYESKTAELEKAEQPRQATLEAY